MKYDEYEGYIVVFGLILYTPGSILAVYRTIDSPLLTQQPNVISKLALNILINNCIKMSP
jgi:hypothetical protein